MCCKYIDKSNKKIVTKIFIHKEKLNIFIIPILFWYIKMENDTVIIGINSLMSKLFKIRIDMLFIHLLILNREISSLGNKYSKRIIIINDKIKKIILNKASNSSKY